MSDGKAHGYITLSRKQFAGNDLLWDDGTAFDTRSAWIWIIQAAAFKDGTYHTAFRLDELKRGEFVASLRYLGQRWKWDKNKVSRFLKMLEKAGRIKGQRKGQHGMVYLLVNYGLYNIGKGEAGTVIGTENGKQTGQQRDKVETINKENKEDMSYSPEFELVWKTYPKRPGDSKSATYRQYEARLKEGVPHNVMLEGTERYKAYCVADGSIGTKYVKMGQTFFGRDKHFTADWGVTPKHSGSTAQRIATRVDW